MRTASLFPTLLSTCLSHTHVISHIPAFISHPLSAACAASAAATPLLLSDPLHHPSPQAPSFSTIFLPPPPPSSLPPFLALRVSAHELFTCAAHLGIFLSSDRSKNLYMGTTDDLHVDANPPQKKGYEWVTVVCEFVWMDHHHMLRLGENQLAHLHWNPTKWGREEPPPRPAGSGLHRYHPHTHFPSSRGIGYGDDVIISRWGNHAHFRTFVFAMTN